MTCDECGREVRPDELTEIVLDGIQVLHCSTRCAFVGGMNFVQELIAEHFVEHIHAKVEEAISRLPFDPSGARSERPEGGSEPGGGGR